MTQSEFDALTTIANEDGWKTRPLLREYLDTVSITQGDEPSTRGSKSPAEFRAAWAYIERRARRLNEEGLEMRQVLKPDYFIPWTKESYHDNVWIPFQRAMYATEHLRELAVGQAGKIHEVIERELGEKHGTDFEPFAPEREDKTPDYPRDYKEPLI